MSDLSLSGLPLSGPPMSDPAMSGSHVSSILSAYPPSFTSARKNSQNVPKLYELLPVTRFKEDTCEPSVSAQEINPKTYLPYTNNRAGV